MSTILREYSKFARDQFWNMWDIWHSIVSTAHNLYWQCLAINTGLFVNYFTLYVKCWPNLTEYSKFARDQFWNMWDIRHSIVSNALNLYDRKWHAINSGLFVNNFTLYVKCWQYYKEYSKFARDQFWNMWNIWHSIVSNDLNLYRQCHAINSGLFVNNFTLYVKCWQN